MVYIGLFLVMALCLGGGGYLVWTAIKHIRLGIEMKRWPQVPATVTSHQTEGDADAVYPYITVAYEFEGRSVTTDCKSPTGTNVSTKLERWFARYPVGSTVMVMVNPMNHEQSFTRRPEVLTIVLSGSFGLLLVTLPLLFLLFSLLAVFGYAQVV